MTRPTNDAIKSCAIKYYSKESGACDQKSTALEKDIFWRESGAEKWERVAVSYKELGLPGNHWALRVRWPGEGVDTIVDPTIRQFGSKKYVFIGTEEEWLAKLGEHIKKCAELKIDVGAQTYRSNMLSYLAKEGCDPNSVTLAFKSQEVKPNHEQISASEDEHVFQTISKQRRTSTGS